jgi:diguanylate cyclase (GGDEF)-like protein/PAS domain S-box-containing protein
MGVGFSAMLYLMTEAIVSKYSVRYDMSLFFSTIFLSIGISAIFFWHLRRAKRTNSRFKSVLSLFVGFSFCVIHFIGSSSTTFTLSRGNHVHTLFSGKLTVSEYAIALTIALFIILIFSLSLLIVSMDAKSTEKLKESEEKYRNLIELSPIGIAVFDASSMIFTFVNPTGLFIFGAKKTEQIIGQDVFKFVQVDYHENVKERVKKISLENKTADFLERKLIQLNGNIIDAEIMGVPIVSNGKKYVQIFFRDITDQKNAQEAIHQMAFYDVLTNLPNRRLFLEKLNNAIHTPREPNKSLAVIFIDLDGFKSVNDTLGHDGGDELLKLAAARFLSCVRSNDIVARFAGDEFMLLLSNISEKKVEKVADRIIQSFQTPIVIENFEFSVTPSIGIALLQSETIDSELLIKQADLAMYEAKNRGKNNYQIRIIH